MPTSCSTHGCGCICWSSWASFITRIAVPAYLMLGYWFLIQILGGFPGLGEESGGVAFRAHAGGFIAGAVLISIFKDAELVAKHGAVARNMTRVKAELPALMRR